MGDERLTYKVSEACKKLGVSEPTLYQAIKKGEVPVIRIGYRILIPIAALDKMLTEATGCRT